MVIDYALNYWLVVRHLMWPIIGIAALVLLALVLDTKLSDRKW